MGQPAIEKSHNQLCSLLRSFSLAVLYPGQSLPGCLKKATSLGSPNTYSTQRDVIGANFNLIPHIRPWKLGTPASSNSSETYFYQSCDNGESTD